MIANLVTRDQLITSACCVERHNDKVLVPRFTQEITLWRG
jgi:hypothetical protein